MSGLQERLDELLPLLRSARTDLQEVEVKDASGGFSQKVLRSVSSFANGSGGLIILGLDDENFTPTGVDADSAASDLVSGCTDYLEPPIRPIVEVCEVEGQLVVVAEVEELRSEWKPCVVCVSGETPIGYMRSHDSDRQLTPYEHHAFQAAKGQPVDDEQPVTGTSIDDLDPDLVSALLGHIRSTRGRVFRDIDDTECLRLLGVLVSEAAPETGAGDGSGGNLPGHDSVSLAGLLALGRYPQRHFPRLDVNFVVYPTESGTPLPDGTRYLDSQPIEGPIPFMLGEADAMLRRNMRRRGVVAGLWRDDYWDYPIDAVREVVINALMHRDYHASARGQPVQMSLYPDRLEITSPGGLYGAFEPRRLLVEPVSAARNARLAKLLRDVSIPGDNRKVCENVGTGLLAVAQSLRAAGMAPPELGHTLTEFRVVFRNHTVLDADATAWLSTVEAGQHGTAPLSDRQRLALAYVRHHGSIDNRGYCALVGCDARAATQELSELRSLGLIERAGGRRWDAWHLSPIVPRRATSSERAVVSGSGNGVGVAQPDSGTRRLPTGYRERQVIQALSDGAKSSRELSVDFGVTTAAVLSWLRRLEERGLVQTTEPGRRSRYQRWELTNGG